MTVTRTNETIPHFSACVGEHLEGVWLQVGRCGLARRSGGKREDNFSLAFLQHLCMKAEGLSIALLSDLDLNN